jgi:hypothetical protein
MKSRVPFSTPEFFRKGLDARPGMAARHIASIVILGAACFVIAPAANAGTVNFNVSDPQISKNGAITITINGKAYPVTVTVGMKAADKADAIADALDNAGFTVSHAPGSTSVKLPALPATNTASLAVGTTGEQQDSITIKGSVVVASVDFNNPNFSPHNFQGGDAVFTAGFSTDAGSFLSSVSAESLSSTSGTAVAQELYAEMEPEASTYGVNLSLNGDVIRATFDQADTVNGAGVIFGTSSTSAGVVGSISSVPEPASLGLLCLGLLGMSVVLRKRLGAR